MAQQRELDPARDSGRGGEPRPSWPDVKPEELSIGFAAEAELAASLRADDYTGPEAANLMGEGAAVYS
jgi:hypothetical protein